MNINQSSIFTALLLLTIFTALLFQGNKNSLQFNELNNAQEISLQAQTPSTITSSLGIKRATLSLSLYSLVPIRINTPTSEHSCSGGPCLVLLTNPPHTEKLDITFSSTQNTTITNIEARVVNYQTRTSLEKLTENTWQTAVYILILLFFVNAIFYPFKSFCRYLIIVSTLAFLLLNDAVFTFLLLLFLTVIYRSRHRLHTRKSTKILLFSILNSIFFLTLFKTQGNALWTIFANPGELNLFMPIGVSYFVIRIIDVQLRWYRGQSLNYNYSQYLYYIIFPGTLIAGPIDNIQAFYENRVDRINRHDIAYGLSRIMIGLFKKIVIADHLLRSYWLGEESGYLFGLAEHNPLFTLIGATDYSNGLSALIFCFLGLLFAYIDFSAYSDIAIGISRLFGHRIIENFYYPFLAPNIREYWKRWHISLSEWSFRNIYFPALIKTKSSFLPLYLVMVSIGLWHALSLSWFLWAIHHASGMTVVSLAQKFINPHKYVLYALYPLRTLTNLVFASAGFAFVFFQDHELATKTYISIALMPFEIFK